MKTLSKKIFPNSKLARILIYLISFFIFCFLFIELSIVFIVKSETMKNKVEQILTENLQTQVNIGSMSWNFGHFYLKDLTIDTQNPFINLKTLEIDFNLTKLDAYFTSQNCGTLGRLVLIFIIMLIISIFYNKLFKYLLILFLIYIILTTVTAIIITIKSKLNKRLPPLHASP